MLYNKKIIIYSYKTNDMLREAILTIPCGDNILDINFKVFYDEERGVEIDEVFELILEDLSYYNFQQLFNLKSQDKEESKTKHFFDLRIDSEWMILSGATIEELLRDRIILNVDRVVINEV